ncbi:MAG TPA: DUF4252 domain-containing protein [Steroidobacteraceae bacterium]|nr:DUF4252 domain-containing protein [Steroidobacteraceae bacterium]
MRGSGSTAAIRLLAAGVLLAAPLASFAQSGRIELPSFAGLEKKAVSSVNISLDLPLLKLVAAQMDNGPDDAPVKAVLDGIEGIYVRSFQFATDHAYPEEEVARVRSQLDAAGWMKLVSVHNNGQNGNVEVCMRRDGNRIEGLVVLATDPRQFTIVNLVGSVDLAKLSQLQGKFGIPNLRLGQKSSGS